jgi:uncharacterized membrane protein
MARSPGPGLVTSGVLLGIGLVGTLDEVVFHQLLDWHHFYELTTDGAPLDARTRTVGLVSDGLFHALSTGVLVLGLLRLARSGLPGRAADRTRLLGGLLVGFGGFNLYDGLVQHKLLDLHQIRRGVPDLLPYDLAWNLVALALLAAGAALLRRPPARAD